MADFKETKDKDCEDESDTRPTRGTRFEERRYHLQRRKTIEVNWAKGCMEYDEE